MTTTRPTTLDGPPTQPASPSSAPRGGATTHIRSVRRAPAPIRHLARITVLALALAGIYAAASHPLVALVSAAALVTVLILIPPRR